MNRFLLVLIIGATLVSCSSKKGYNPDQLSPQEKDRIITALIRYAVKAPENVSETEKFDAKHDDYYRKVASTVRLEQYAEDGENRFFLLSKPAPSLIEKRNATGGRFILNDKGELKEYEEIFRTWKLVPDTLNRRSYFLFDKMVRREPLEQYYTKNSNGVEYIEFPDDKTYFDVASRSWKIK